jgi:hypothetical protein
MIKIHQISSIRPAGTTPASGKPLLTDAAGSFSLGSAMGMAVGRISTSNLNLSVISTYSFYPSNIAVSNISNLYITGSSQLQYVNYTTERTTFMMEFHLNMMSMASNASVYFSIGTSSGTYVNPQSFPASYYYSPTSQPNSGVALLTFGVDPGMHVEPTVDISVSGASGNMVSNNSYWRMFQIN